jgi:hypothetical protein
MESERSEFDSSFSLVAGGPLYRVLRRLGLLGMDQLPTLRTAAAVALFAWLPPALLAVAQTLTDSGYQGWGYFTDLTVPARFLVAIGAMIATERYADSRFRILGRQFRESRLLSSTDVVRFDAIVRVADRMSSSRAAEGVILLTALVVAGLVIERPVQVAGALWEGHLAAGQVSLSWAGTVVRYVSQPLFFFLALRWGWWFLVWGALLFRVSRLRLKLIAPHPDRAAGLGFLAIYPSVFSGFAFSLSCVFSATILKALSLRERSAELVWLGISGWLGLNLVVFLGPLLVFSGPMFAAREQALLEYGRMATLQHLALRRTWTGETPEEHPAEPGALYSTGDLQSQVEAIRAMGYIPVDWGTVVQLVVACGLPFLPVVVKLVPRDTLVDWALGIL